MVSFIQNISSNTFYLSLHSSVSKFLSQKKSHLVVFRCLLEFSKEDVSIAEIAMSSPLCTPITELLGNFKSFLMIVDCFAEVTQQVVNIPQVTAGSALSCSVLNEYSVLCKTRIHVMM